MSSHTSLAQDLSHILNISIVIHERTSLSRFSCSTSTCLSLSSSFPSTSCISSSTLSSTTWSPWKACATAPTMGVTTPTTSQPPSQSAHTMKRPICSWRKSWHCVIQHGQRVQPCNQRGEHRLQNSRITTFCSETITWRQRSNLFQKLENHRHRHALQGDLQLRRPLNPFSKESRDVIKAAGNIELCELLDVEPQFTVQSMSVVLGRRHRLLHVRSLLARWYEREQEVHQAHYWSLADSGLLHKERSTPRSPIREERRLRVLRRESAQKKCKKRDFLNIHDSFIRDARFQKTMIELGRTEEVIREMDKLANEDHTHHFTPDEIRVYRNDCWTRSNFVGSDTMPVRHRADFKEALSIFRHLKNQEDQVHNQNSKSSSSSRWNRQDSRWHSSSEYHRDDGPSTDRWSNLIDGDWANYSEYDSQNLMQNYSEDSVTANSRLLSPTGGVKSKTPMQENSM